MHRFLLPVAASVALVGLIPAACHPSGAGERNAATAVPAADEADDAQSVQMDPSTAFEALAADLSGQPISFLWRGYGSAVFIEFGDLTPTARLDGSPGHPQGQMTLGVEWSWRIEDPDSILCGSSSEEALWEPAFARLRDTRVQGLKLFGALPEVELSTDQGLRFVSFSATDGQPRWHVVDRRKNPKHWFSVRQGRLHLGDGTEPAL